MNEEQPTPQGNESPEATPSSVPTDFVGYVKWRNTGETSAESEAPKQAGAGQAGTEPPPAKTEPDSAPEEPQQEEEEEEPQGEAGRRGRQRRQKIAELARENAELKAQLAAAAPLPQPQKPAEQPGKPKLENFETLEAYQEALTEWHLDQREARRQADEDAKAERDAQEKLQTEWTSKQQTARKAHKDYDSVIESVAAPAGPGVADARQAMLEDPAGAEILYYLCTHPGELKRIAALHPIAAVREIGRLSATFSPPVANGKQRLSDAPPPPPARGKPAPVTESLDDPEVQKDFRKWERLRLAQLRNR